MQLKKSLSLVLILVLALGLLTACGNNDKKAADTTVSIVGTWVISYEEMMKAAGQEAPALPDGVDASISFDFSQDGKLTIGVMGQSVDAGTYTVDGDKVKMDMGAISGAATGQQGEATYSIKDNKLSLTIEGNTIELTKK